MKYDSLRPTIRNGDLLTCYGTAWESRLIRWWTGGPSHVGVAAWQRFSAETQERLCILESTEAGGLRPYPLSAALANYQAQGGKVCWQRLLPESGIDGDELVGRMAERWGFGYPRRYQFLLIASPHLRWARKRLRGKGCDLNESADHCSEAIAFGLQGCRVKLDREPVEWNPKLLSLLPYWGPPAEVTP